MAILYRVGKLQHSFLSNFIFEQTNCYKSVRKGRDFAGTDFWKFRDNCLKMFSCYSFVTFLYKYLFSFLTPFRESGHLLLATVKRREWLETSLPNFLLYSSSVSLPLLKRAGWGGRDGGEGACPSPKDREISLYSCLM